MPKISPLLGPVEKIPIKDICLDPDNPRLGKDPKVQKMNQGDLLKHYLNVENDAIAKHKPSIQKQGVLEPIHVIHAPKDNPCKYIVKEGNVRLAILKHLTEEQEKGNIEPPDAIVRTVVNDEVKSVRIRWDVIPAQIYKKGTKNSEILLHLIDMQKERWKFEPAEEMKEINKLLSKILEDTKELGTFDESKRQLEQTLKDAELTGIDVDVVLGEDGKGFTREDLEKICVKLGLGKPSEEISIKALILLIKYRLEFGP